MKLAIHHNTFKKIAGGAIDQIIVHSALSSRISVTPSILLQYDKQLSQHPLFTSWFSAAQTQKRIDVCNPSTSPARVQVADKDTQEYATASYFAGSNLLLSSDDLDAASIAILDSIGTNFLYSNSPLPEEIQGDNPFHIINTKTGGDIDFDILNRYFKPEDTVTIYDKYINSTSIELIEHIASQLQPTSTLAIYHSNFSGKNLLKSAQIHQRASAANPHIIIKCMHCSRDFVRNNHDRYIFFGDRCQATFTAGLDCFGLIDTNSGKRANKKSTIAFFDTSKSGSLAIEGYDGSLHVVRHYSA